MKKYTFKLTWRGPGWYTGRFAGDNEIIVERSSNGGPDAEAIENGQAAIWYDTPPCYMQRETERQNQ